MSTNLPFGGKIILLLGDFRQTCPVIWQCTCADVVRASIKSSHLWPLFQIRRLTQPLQNAQDPLFARYVDSIGDGLGPQVSLDMLQKTTDKNRLIDFVFPPETYQQPLTCLARCILAPTNAQVDAYNDMILDRITGSQETYFASDSLAESKDAGLLPPQSMLDYVADRTPIGLPPFKMKIKTNTIFRLLCNFSIDRGLVKNTRVVVTDVGR